MHFGGNYHMPTPSEQHFRPMAHYADHPYYRTQEKVYGTHAHNFLH